MIIETIKLYELGLIPEFFLSISIIYILMYGLFASFNSINRFPLLQPSLISLSLLCLIMVCFLLMNENLNCQNYINFCNTISTDYLSFSAKLIINISSIMCLLYIQNYLETQKINSFEYTLILLFAVLGLFLLCSANDLLTAYLAIELQSLAFYVLAAFKKTSTYSTESGLKYFILGAFSSGLFLFGSSLIYGTCGSINFDDLKDLWILNSDLPYNHYNLMIIGLMFVYVSLFFKLSLAPFHVWSPDVYEGSPTSSTLYFVIVPKISLFVLLLRLAYYVFPNISQIWQESLIIIALSSILIGSVTGLEQRKFKSLLAYSSISNMGYLLISFSTNSLGGLQALFSYIVIYIFSGLCIWSVFMFIRLKTIHNDKQNKDLGDFALLFKSNSFMSGILSTALFSLAGLPPMIGFLVKISIFLVAVEESLYLISLISIVLSVISTFFYLRIIKIMFFEPILVGCLYYPIKTNITMIAAFTFYLFIFLFINPSILYLFSQKAIFLLV